MDWVTASWGRFRCWERVQPQRMSRQQLAGARACYEALVEVVGTGDVDSGVERAMLAGVEHGSDGHAAGAVAFACWFKTHLAALKRSAAAAVGNGDGAAAADNVSVQLL